MNTRWMYAVILPILLMGCADGQDVEPNQSRSTLDDSVLRLNHFQGKGTHNSYHVESWFPIPEWQYSHAKLPIQAEEQGVRKFELDLHYNPLQDRVDVFHAVIIDSKSTCRSLSGCLSEMKAWSDQNPAHHPIFFLLEPKENPPETDPVAFMALLEETILRVWPEDRIVTPDLLRGNHDTLPEAIAEDGWPAMDAVRGRAFFILHDTGLLRDIYTESAPALEGKAMFVESNMSDPFGAFLVMNDPIGGAEQIKNAVEAGFLVRTRNDSGLEWDDAKNEAALASGAHIISTDFPAPAYEGALYLDIPGGNPSRCNPLIAPPNCTAEMVEDLP